MARRRRTFGTDDEENYFPTLLRGAGGQVVEAPKTRAPGQPPKGMTPPKAGPSKDDKKKTLKKVSEVSTYQGYLNAQKKEASKAAHKAARSSIMSAESLRGQANALLRLLGRSPNGPDEGFGGLGGNGKGGGITNTPGGKDIKGNVHWAGGTNWKPDGSGPKRPGQNADAGVRTGTDVKPGLGGPKFPGTGGNKPPVFNLPRTAAGRNAGEEGTRPGDNTGKDQQAKPGQGGGKKKNGQGGGWKAGEQWKNKHGQGSGGGDGDNNYDGEDIGGGDKGDRNLRHNGLSEELRVNLKNVERAMRTADEVLMTGFKSRVGSLEAASADNDKAADAQSFANTGNRGRERMNAISELMAQGAGESDVLRGQQMSLRNWGQNQSEVNRAFNDTLTSVNASLTDLNTDTRSAYVGNQQAAIDDKAQLWNSYFDAKSEALTNLGNTYGQMSTDYRNADEQLDGKKGSKKTARRANRLQKKADLAFMDAAKVGSQAHKTQKVDDERMDWAGRAAFNGQLNNNQLQSMAPGAAMLRPEGANLRKWNA